MRDQEALMYIVDMIIVKDVPGNKGGILIDYAVILSMLLPDNHTLWNV
jgi:hypothetical protein